MKTVFVAGGCFWGVEAWFQKARGIIKAESYYLNGGHDDVSYEEVCSSSGHVEAVKLIYDETMISEVTIFDLLLKVVNPYSLNRQGNDRGVQYRIGFYMYKDQPELYNTFKQLRKNFEEENKKTYLEVEYVTDETRAEEYHQKYLQKNVGGYCHISLSSFPQELAK